MKGTFGFVIVVCGIICLTVSCASTPQANQNDSTSASTATETTASKTNAEGEASPEVSSPLPQPGAEEAPPLSEPPRLFPEASPIPIQPAITPKRSSIALPTPTVPALPPNTSTAVTSPDSPQDLQTGSIKPEGKSTAGSAAPEKKASAVDPQSLKAPEPKTDTDTVRETAVTPLGGIPELPFKTNPALAEEPVVLSRSVRATVGQLVEIPYQGAGWVYLGEVGGKKGLAYDSRRLDAEGQTFVFRCESSGTYTVKFFKQDFIKDYIINDYVEVVVGESPMPAPSVTGAFSLPVDRGRVVANPRWPTPASTAGTTAPAATVPGGTASPAGTATADAAPATSVTAASAGDSAQTIPSPAAAVQSSPEAPPLESLSLPEDFINLAKKEFAAGQYAAALSTLQAFTEKYPAGSDEAWWIYGQILEAKGPQRDIKGALSYYKRLINEYPQSPRYDEAQKRIAYLERFYFDIR